MARTVRARTTKLDEVPLVEKQRAAVVQAGQVADLAWTIVDEAGLPLDLSAYDPGGGTPDFPPVRLRLQEAALRNAIPPEAQGSFVSAAAGQVTLPLDASKVAPGVYEASVAICDPTSGAIGPIDQFYLFVEPSQFGGDRSLGPPTLRQLRLRMRDSSPAENRLLDETLFDDADLIEALLHPVRYWNSALPPIAPYDTTTFPGDFRGPWIDAACGLLWRIAAGWYFKNQLTTTAGGVSVSDMDKGQACAALAQQLWDAYQQWVRSMKVSMNIQSGFGYVGSPYGLRGWGGIGYY